MHRTRISTPLQLLLFSMDDCANVRKCFVQISTFYVHLLRQHFRCISNKPLALKFSSNLIAFCAFKSYSAFDGQFSNFDSHLQNFENMKVEKNLRLNFENVEKVVNVENVKYIKNVENFEKSSFILPTFRHNPAHIFQNPIEFSVFGKGYACAHMQSHLEYKMCIFRPMASQLTRKIFMLKDSAVRRKHFFFNLLSNRIDASDLLSLVKLADALRILF